jgi:hypothetical protein
MFEHIERLVGQCGREFQHQGRECSVAPQRLQFRQVLHRTLAALAGEFKPMILVNPRGALGLKYRAREPGSIVRSALENCPS